MSHIEKWIWLPKKLYPQNQTTIYSDFLDKTDGNYTVAEFYRNYSFSKKITEVSLRFSGDTRFELYCNGDIIATGPVCVGGDYLLRSEIPSSKFYATEMTFCPDGYYLDFYARVTMMPLKMCDFSMGHGGFMLTAYITFEDGTKTIVHTDSSWNVRLNSAYMAPGQYDGRIFPDNYEYAQETTNIWHTETAPLSVLTEEKKHPLNASTIILEPGEEKELVLDFDRIYSGYVFADVKFGSDYNDEEMVSSRENLLFADIYPREIAEKAGEEHLIFANYAGNTSYRSNIMHSAGNMLAKLANKSEVCVEISLGIIFTCYPAEYCAMTMTSDEALNAVLDVCRHTLKICRQTIHLDSPRHCEPLGCTGDYYIETLMTAFSYGDMKLAMFDAERTAEILRNNDGIMFHTTYSLIWVRMLYDLYLFTGNSELLYKCEDALLLLLKRFTTYMGENGLIETPPNFMFVDWIYVDEFSLHHPPKALGQTVLNLFYFQALDYAEKIFTILGEPAMVQDCHLRRDALGEAINCYLYDQKKGLYFEGLNTSTPEHLLGSFMPQNTNSRYYLKHSNILATYVGVCDIAQAQTILDKIMNDECPGDYQPYFAHYLLEAIYKNKLREKYTLKVLEKWKQSALSFSKGLVEGFIEPNAGYVFDHSHAWGGTPLYSLPKALLGLEITEPGMKQLTLQPSLLGLKNTSVEFPTPYGNVVCKLCEGQDPVITWPVEVIINIVDK